MVFISGHPIAAWVHGLVMPLTFGSLFAGIGGIDLGFERAGLVCKWQVEIDDYAQKVLAKHWPEVHREKDIRQCGAHNLEYADVIAGGFPCQDISYAGRGAGLDGERSGLFFEAIRVVRELQPRFVVLENVAALLTRGLDGVLGTLAEIGYDGEWHCIPAAAVGAPHIRDRVFVIATVANARCELREPRPVSESCSEASPHWNAEATNDQRCGEDVADSASKRFENICRSEAITKCFRQRTISRSDWWDVEPAVGRVAHGVPARVDRLRGLGNAVVPAIAEWIGRRLIESVER
jgi:DNA (cytosine-5)-methyltransferase 1